MCVCSRDYEIVDHVSAEKLQLWMDLRLPDTEWGTPIRDILGGSDWRSIREVLLFP
jgi:hypothetical protein